MSFLVGWGREYSMDAMNAVLSLQGRKLWIVKLRLFGYLKSCLLVFSIEFHFIKGVIQKLLLDHELELKLRGF